jgi:DivIVA domain-containing protein
MVPFDAFLEEQRRLRVSSKAGPLGDAEVEFLTERLLPLGDELGGSRDQRSEPKEPNTSLADSGSVGPDPMLRSVDVSNKTFKVALRGYAEDEVDRFRDRVSSDLRMRESGDMGKLTPQDVQQQTFKVALRGYAEDEVDEFLDEVTQQLKWYYRGQPPPRRPLAPLDVRKKTFKVALRGYAEDEVDEFLNRVEAALEEWESDGKAALSAWEVQQQTFKVALRGYAEDEVDRFSDEIAEALRQQEQRATGMASSEEAQDESALVEPREAAEVAPGDEPPAFRPDATVDTSVNHEEQPAPKLAETSTVPPAPTERPSTVTKLSITRPDRRGRPYTIMFDDQPLGILRTGGTVEFDIPTGLHWVTVKTRRHESNTMVIEPQEGDLIRLECQPAGGDQIDDLGRNIDGILLERVGS